MTTVSIYGAGQLGAAVAALLRERHGLEVNGPHGRGERTAALAAGADVVLVVTTTRLADVVDDIATAVRAGSNVITSAEEAAYPAAVDARTAREIDALARKGGVTVLGAGLNPGLLFDALVLTLLGAAPPGCTIHVRRVVDISGFGPTVLRRIGVGLTELDFSTGVAEGTVFGHAGFPQSMEVVGNALGLTVERVDRQLRPVVTDRDVAVGSSLMVHAGESAGVDQRYTAVVSDAPWFTAEFFGHVRLSDHELAPADDIELRIGGTVYQRVSTRPGVNAQIGSANMIANSVERVFHARPGWITVADLPPAFPRVTSTGTRDNQPHAH